MAPQSAPHPTSCYTEQLCLSLRKATRPGTDSGWAGGDSRSVKKFHCLMLPSWCPEETLQG
eukprot:7153654-Pyramimonas_sp.AAC.1